MWPIISYETYPWVRDADDLAMIPKSRRQRIRSTYEAALPASIAQAEIELPRNLLERASELKTEIARFDQMQQARGYNLPALMLRSESSSSSQIEQLTSSVRNVALAELSTDAPRNAQLIAGNVAAMRHALSQTGEITESSILAIHSALMREEPKEACFRCEQVWIGGTPYSPHDAKFVPPHHSKINMLLEDLILFSQRQNIEPIAKAALFHAQFETIHPFIDGNGRTGRALLHRMLALDEVLLHTTLPVSAGLLHNVQAYMDALDAYHKGNIEEIIERLLDALELALVIGAHIAQDVDRTLCVWREAIDERRGSALHRLPAILIEQPVVNTKYLSEHLELSERASRNLVERACEKGILKKIGNAKRGIYYQADELIDILEDASSSQGIKRMASY